MAQHTILDETEIDLALKRMAHQIIEDARGRTNLLVLGIPTRGVHLAERLAQVLRDTDPRLQTTSDLCGILDITMYRDDLRLGSMRAPVPSRLPSTGIDGRYVILVDDVLFSGRTVRAALDALSDVGRPELVKLAVLVDRGHHLLPISPDYVGKQLPTAVSERVHVRVQQVDGENGVFISRSTEEH